MVTRSAPAVVTGTGRIRLWPMVEPVAIRVHAPPCSASTTSRDVLASREVFLHHHAVERHGRRQPERGGFSGA
jgi:hypothetical protein